MHPSDEGAGQRDQALVIAGDPHILSQVRRILEKAGFATTTATSGQAGLSLFRQELPDLVLLDLQLPDTSGLDLVQQIKEERRYTPVMVMASASETSVVAALRRGADDYLSKPIVPEELLERVQHNLERGRQARAQAELTGQLQRQLAMLLSVREVARETTSTADLYALLQRVLEQTLRNLHLDAGIVFVSENGDLIPLAHRGLPQAIASALTRRRLSWSETALRPLRRARRAVRIRSDEQRGGPLSRAMGYKFTALVPLWAQEHCWGLLEMAGQDEPADPAQYLEMLTTVGQQVAIALANTRLQEAAALRVHELAMLNEACLALTSDLDLEQILTTIMLRTSDVIGVETGSLLLADELSGELVFRISLGGYADRILSQRIPPGQGISGWVFQNGQPLLVPDVRQDARYYPEIDHYTGFHTRSILCVPLKVRGESFGVIELVNKISGEFTADDLHLVESVAALTATAVEQSRMHEWTTSFIMVDPQTHLPNHRLLAEALARESARCRRYGRTCSLLMLGVDRRLKLSEPRWRELTAVLKKALRQSDMLCRHRDGPFVAILPETGREGTGILAERLLEEVGRAGLSEPPGVELAGHMRYGIATFPGDAEDPTDLLQQAEKALAQAWQERQGD